MNGFGHNKIFQLHFSKCMLSVFASILFAAVITYDSIYGLYFILGMGLLFCCARINLEHVLISFLLIYPILPVHAGVDLGFSIPVIKVHRALVILLIMSWISKKDLMKHMRSLFNFPLTKIIVGLMAYFVVEYYFKRDFQKLFFSVGNMFFENFMIAFIYYDYYKNKSKKDIEKLFLVIMLSALTPCFLGVIEVLSSFNPFVYIQPYREAVSVAVGVQERLGVMRAKGAFHHAIPFGVFFSMVAPSGIIYSLFIREKDKRLSNIILFVALLITFIGCYISFSRLALVAYFLNVVPLMIFYYFSTGCVYLFVAAIALMQPFFLKDFKQKLYSLISGIFGLKASNAEMRSSSNARIGQIVYNWGTIKNSLILGNYSRTKVGILDNFYLVLLFDNGLIGLLFFTSLLIYPLISALVLTIKTKDKFLKRVSIYTVVVLFTSLVVLFGLALVDYLYLVWVTIGIFYASQKIYIKQ